MSRRAPRSFSLPQRNRSAFQEIMDNVMGMADDHAQGREPEISFPATLSTTEMIEEEVEAARSRNPSTRHTDDRLRQSMYIHRDDLEALMYGSASTPPNPLPLLGAGPAVSTPRVSRYGRLSHQRRNAREPEVSLKSLHFFIQPLPGVSSNKNVIGNAQFAVTDFPPFYDTTLQNMTVTCSMRSDSSMDQSLHNALSSRPCWNDFDVSNWEVTEIVGQSYTSAMMKYTNIGDWLSANRSSRYCVIRLRNPARTRIRIYTESMANEYLRLREIECDDLDEQEDRPQLGFVKLDKCEVPEIYVVPDFWSLFPAEGNMSSKRMWLKRRGIQYGNDNAQQLFTKACRWTANILPKWRQLVQPALEFLQEMNTRLNFIDPGLSHNPVEPIQSRESHLDRREREEKEINDQFHLHARDDAETVRANEHRRRRVVQTSEDLHVESQSRLRALEEQASDHESRLFSRSRNDYHQDEHRRSGARSRSRERARDVQPRSSPRVRERVRERQESLLSLSVSDHVTHAVPTTSSTTSPASTSLTSTLVLPQGGSLVESESETTSPNDTQLVVSDETNVAPETSLPSLEDGTVEEKKEPLNDEVVGRDPEQPAENNLWWVWDEFPAEGSSRRFFDCFSFRSREIQQIHLNSIHPVQCSFDNIISGAEFLLMRNALIGFYNQNGTFGSYRLRTSYAHSPAIDAGGVTKHAVSKFGEQLCASLTSVPSATGSFTLKNGIPSETASIIQLAHNCIINGFGFLKLHGFCYKMSLGLISVEQAQQFIDDGNVDLFREIFCDHLQSNSMELCCREEWDFECGRQCQVSYLQLIGPSSPSQCHVEECPFSNPILLGDLLKYTNVSEDDRSVRPFYTSPSTFRSFLMQQFVLYLGGSNILNEMFAGGLGVRSLVPPTKRQWYFDTIITPFYINLGTIQADLVFASSSHPYVQKVISWWAGASVEDRGNFLEWSTGSMSVGGRGVTPRIRIDVNSSWGEGAYPAAHACSNAIETSAVLTDEVFLLRVLYSMSRDTEDGPFDSA